MSRGGGRALALAAALGFVLSPAPAEPQPATGAARVGYLTTATRGQYVEAVQERLRELGWVEGRNLTSAYREAGGRIDRLAALAGDLARARVDVVVAIDTAAAHAAKEASGGVPVVFAASDPRRLVGNLAHPGGNLTGVTNVGTDIAAKQLELLRELVPAASRAAVLARPDSPATAPFLREIETAARSLGLRLEVLAARDAGELSEAFRGLRRHPADVLVVQADSLFFTQRKRIVDFAAAQRLPAIYGAREFPRAGGLISYGTNLPALYRQLGTYVDRILRGARPGDLPVEQPTTFELVINARAARTLGIAVPAALRVRADEIVE
jgi:putative ABC transport system substrate-binding protein